MLLQRKKSHKELSSPCETDLDRFMWSRETLIELSKQLAQQAEAILAQHSNYVDSQIRNHSIATNPNSEEATISFTTEQIPVAYGNHFVQL